MSITSPLHQLEPAAHGNGRVVPVEQGRDLGRALRRYWWVVLAVTAATVAAAFVVTASMPKRYDASAKVLLTAAEPVDVIQQTATRSLDPERDLNTGVSLVGVQRIAQSVHDDLRLPLSAEALASEISAELVGNSNVLSITARDASPTRAAKIANAFAHEYAAFRRQAAAAPYDDAVSLARARLAALHRGPATRLLRADLEQRMQSLQTTAALQTGNVQLLDAAVPAASPATPRTKLNLVAALILGTFLGSCIAAAIARSRKECWTPAA